MIGKPSDERHACSEAVHLPNCYNPGLDLTACVCGARWWRGQVGTWHSRQIRTQVGETMTGRPLYETAGWDRYFLHACEQVDVAPAPEHVCGGVESMSAAEAFPRQFETVEGSA